MGLVGCISMLLSIDLDDQSRRQMTEICDIAPKRNLAAEVPFLQGYAMPQVPPELLFRFSQSPSQEAGLLSVSSGGGF